MPLRREGASGKRNRYGGRNLWKWLGLYAILAVVLYGGAYAVYAYTRPHKLTTNTTQSSSTDSTNGSSTTAPTNSSSSNSSNGSGFYNY